MKKIFCVLLILILLLFVQCEKVGQKKLQELAEAVNKTAPHQIDETTTLDSCTVLPDGVLKYHYTLDIDDFSNFSVPVFELYQQRDLINALKQGDESVQDILASGVTLRYAYYHNQKEFVAIDIANDDFWASDDLAVDSVAFKKIERITSMMKDDFPQETQTGIMEGVETIFPRTLEMNVVETELSKTNDFDSLIFKQQRMDEYFGSLDGNLYSSFLGGNANIVYRYVFCDQEGNYLATIESTIKEYKERTASQK